MSYAAVVDEAGAAPAPALAGLVREYGGSRIEGAAPGIHRGLPSHHLELNICLGDPIALAVMPDPLQPPGSFAALVAGLQTRPAVIAHGGSVYAISVQLSPEAVAETITNNMRKVIIDERAMNPKYYDKMSQLLDAILEERRQGALEYQQYLAKLLEHATKLGKGESDTRYPAWANNGARRALIDFFDQSPELADVVDTTVLHAKPDSWVGNAIKEKSVKRALARALPDGFDRLDELFELVKARHEYR